MRNLTAQGRPKGRHTRANLLRNAGGYTKPMRLHIGATEQAPVGLDNIDTVRHSARRRLQDIASGRKPWTKAAHTSLPVGCLVNVAPSYAYMIGQRGVEVQDVASPHCKHQPPPTCGCGSVTAKYPSSVRLVWDLVCANGETMHPPGASEQPRRHEHDT